MSPSRRSLLKKGAFGGALLVVGSAVPLGLQRTRRGVGPRTPLALLSPDEHAVFAAVAARVVPGEGAGPEWPTAESLDCAGKADALLAQTHPEIGQEMKQLLRLFENGLSGLLTLGAPRPFTTLDGAAQDARLEAWRRSRLPLLRTGYQAMVRLAHATYHASPEVYPLLGYPGPPNVPRGP